MSDAATADRHSNAAARVLALTLPGDTVLYLLLPVFATQFGVTLAEAGILLAANRLIRIVCYGLVVRFYNGHGSRTCCLAAVAMSAVAASGYAALSGVWALLVMRLIWGIAFAFMNIATQVTATALPEGAAERSGRSRAIISLGPMIALPVAALIAMQWGPRVPFVVLAVLALLAFWPCRQLPEADRTQRPGRRFGWPAAIDVWSFVHGFALDGVFVFMLALVAAAHYPREAVLAAAIALALRYCAEVFLAPAGGRIAGRYGARRVLTWLTIASGLAMAAVDIALPIVAIIAVVIVRGLIQPLPAPVAAELAPKEHRVMALANLATWRDLGAGLGPLAAGWAAASLEPGMVYAIVGLAFAATALLLVSRRTANRAS